MGTHPAALGDDGDLAFPGRGGQGREGQGQASSAGSEGARGQQGVDGGRGGELSRLQDEFRRQVRQTQELIDQHRRDSPALGQRLSTPEGWQPSLSAPGTEAFKQDFAKWEILRKDVNLALEQLEGSISKKLREKAARDRMNAGANDSVPEEYRALVDRYYRALAARKR